MGKRNLVLLLVTTQACLGPPRLVPGPARNYLEANPQHRVWATLADGSNVTLENPRMIGDTVFALSDGKPVTVPADRVSEVRAKRVSRARTGALVLGVALAT